LHPFLFVSKDTDPSKGSRRNKRLQNTRREGSGHKQNSATPQQRGSGRKKGNKLALLGQDQDKAVIRTERRESKQKLRKLTQSTLDSHLLSLDSD